MQVTETLSDGLRRGFTVVVPAAEIESRRTKRLTELSRQVRIPGFRPGKVPMPVVKQRYGTAVQAEVLEESVQEATQQMLTERGLRAAQQPKVDVVTLGDAANDLEFKVELELLPEIAMPDFAAIELTRYKSEPNVETIDRALGEIAARQRELVIIDEARGAASGETLVVDFIGKVDGVAFPGGTADDVPVEIGGQGFIPGFAEQLEGLVAGETRTITVTFPPEYQAKELAGKEASFEVTAKALKRSVPPAIDDALAEKIGMENLDELRSALSSRVQREYDQLSRMRIKRQLLDALNTRAAFDVPEGMVDAEFGQIWERVEADRKEGRLDAEDSGKDDDTLRSEYRAIAARRVRLGLLLAEIGRANGLTVAPDEMQRAMRNEAGRYPGQEQQVMEFFRKNPQAAENLRGPIFEEKVVDFVLELANVTEKLVPPEELSADPDEPIAVAAPVEAAAMLEAVADGEPHHTPSEHAEPDQTTSGHDGESEAGQTAGAAA